MNKNNLAKFFTFLVLALLLAASQDLMSQPAGVKKIPLDKSGKVMTKDRVQTLNFEDELVEGSAQKPELFYLFQKRNFNYKRLIKLRENFLPEMGRTAEGVQRLRGGN